MYPVSGTAIPIEPCAEGPFRVHGRVYNDDELCLIETPNAICLYEIQQKFSLNEEEAEIIQHGVNDYCSDNVIKRLAFSALDYPKRVFINTPWQKAIKVLENKIDGEKRKEVAVFLLTFCLAIQRLQKEQSPVPGLPTENLGLTIEQCLEKANCKIIPPFEKNWNIGKNARKTISEEL